MLKELGDATVNLKLANVIPKKCYRNFLLTTSKFEKNSVKLFEDLMGHFKVYSTTTKFFGAFQATKLRILTISVKAFLNLPFFSFFVSYSQEKASPSVHFFRVHSFGFSN